MICLYAGMNKINNELRRTQNELMPPLATNPTNPTNSNELTSPEFVSFRTSSLLFSGSFMSRRFIADFAVHDHFHRKERKGRKDSLNVLYAINHREHREKQQSISIPGTTYEKAAASRFRMRMPRIARIFADIVDHFAAPFHSPDNKPQRSQRTQSRLEKLWAVSVLGVEVTLLNLCKTRIYTYLRVSASSAQSAFYFIPSAFICVHPRLISVSLGDRAGIIRGEL